MEFLEELEESKDEIQNSIDHLTHGLRRISRSDEKENKDFIKNLFDEVVESLQGDAEDVSIYEGYSGRCMYGERCYGISGEDPIKIIERAAQFGITGARYDNLGRDYIVYWPSFVWTASEETEEDE